jgi:hypothetical protein
MGDVTTMDKKELYKYVSAFVMGDGGVYYSGKNCRYQASKLTANLDYVLWQQSILSEITHVNVRDVVNLRGDQKPHTYLETRSHPIFTDVRKRVYIDNYKSVDPHYLTLLDWEMLAILYMDDGSLDVDKRCDATPTARLNTKRLSYGDSWLLKKAIKDTLGIEFNVSRHYDRWFLRLRAKDALTFFNGISPFIVPSFRYKLPHPSDSSLNETVI